MPDSAHPVGYRYTNAVTKRPSTSFRIQNHVEGNLRRKDVWKIHFSGVSCLLACQASQTPSVINKVHWKDFLKGWFHRVKHIKGVFSVAEVSLHVHFPTSQIHGSITWKETSVRRHLIISGILSTTTESKTRPHSSHPATEKLFHPEGTIIPCMSLFLLL